MEIDNQLPVLQLLIQGGAFALVAYIVVFAYPKSSREAREERESRDARFDRLIDQLQANFDSRNKQIVEAVEKQTQIIATSLQSSSARIEGAVSTVCKSRGN